MEMIRTPGRLARFVVPTAAIGVLLMVAAASAADGTAKGTLNFKAKAGNIAIAPKFVYLVTGPDAFDASKAIRHLIFSTTDLSAKIKACTTVSCTDGDLGDGMTVDLDGGPRLNYWMVLNDQTVQYSGTAPTSSLKLTADTPARLAGRIAFDGASAGGPSVDIEFDTPVTKEMTKAR
jgi:hypothetical protein